MMKRMCVVWGVVLLGAGYAGAQAPATVSGRYVHITLPGKSRTLSLAEVQVFSGGKNVALKKATVQSHTGHGGVANRGVDGNTNGDWAKGSITHTVNDCADPAWELDLGAVVPIEKIAVWNRQGFESRLNSVQVTILDGKRKAVWGASVAKPGRGATNLIVKDHTKCPWMGKSIAKVVPTSSPKPNRSSKGKSRGRSAPKVVVEGTPTSLRLAIQDLKMTFGARYPKADEFLARLAKIEPAMDKDEGKKAFEELKREALMANPLLDFDKLLLVRRRGSSGMPANWQGNSSLKTQDTVDKKTGKRRPAFDNELVTLSPLLDGKLTVLYEPSGGQFVGDFDLHFDADKILFSSIAKNGSWGIFEVKVDGTGLRQVSPDMGEDVDNYDPVYLPDGRIIFDSSSGYQGVPCVGGKDYVGNLHIMNAAGTNIRRLCFEQDNDWCPVMLNNGRVMYLRWEYTDSAHYFSRVLMSMNPDGTDQRAFYGSNSYWPNSLFYARPIPGSATQFVGIVSGHHGVRREGELVLFDAARGRFEADGAVQRIPGYGKKVEAITLDGLVNRSHPRFLHPYPLSDKYFLASCNARGGWSLYLVDVFDNMLLLKQEQGAMLFEPVPLRRTARPPVIPDRVRPGAKDAVMLITDIYEGPGLAGVPRGTVKALRVYKYEYSPRRKGGHYSMGMESGWDVHFILGTVPVEEDGSVVFRVPANTPLSLQPLDADGKALQLMRSWLVAMPGEVGSCVGCHEPQNIGAPVKPVKAGRRVPHEITPWYGPARGFSFAREVQPVLDRYCVGCHSGASSKKAGKTKPDFSRPDVAYKALHPYVRRNGPEGDYHLLTPLEFHADTSELIQMLQKGHYNVRLNDEAWSRLVTWIDLNAPKHGTWAEAGAKKEILDRRLELRKQYAAVTSDAEHIVNPYSKESSFIKPKLLAKPRPEDMPAVDGWPMTAPEATRLQAAAGSGGTAMDLDLGKGMKLKLVRVPEGTFPMGSLSETPVERPVAPVTIDQPFWMGATEVTLEQYRRFKPDYMNGVYDMHYKDQVKRGYFVNEPKFPVIRVSWQQAMDYCRWLSSATGRKVTLPTEAQWEWACRAGTATPLSFGDFDTDFSGFANLSDAKVVEMAVKGVNPKPIRNPSPDWDYELKDSRFNDRVLHLADVGKYKANAWGLHDLHGNVAEWTRSAYAPYPYNDTDGRNDVTKCGKKVVRGGSWHDRQHRSTSSYRLGFPDWQRVYHVGFRVVVEDE